MTQPLEFGLDTFGDVTAGSDGELLAQPQVISNVVEEAVLADWHDIDFFGVGEHHCKDFAVSAPEVVLAAIAARTSKIRLGSAVTVHEWHANAAKFLRLSGSLPSRLTLLFIGSTTTEAYS